jgi:hypothetical protein
MIVQALVPYDMLAKLAVSALTVAFNRNLFR